MAKTEARIREDIDVFDMIAGWGGWLVFGGLVAETVYAWVFRGNRPFAEAYTPVFANALVAAGVLIEFKFLEWSAEGKDALALLSNEKVAVANRAAEEAKERAAKAELALEKLRAPRMLSEEQFQTLTDEMKRFAGSMRRVTIGAFPYTYESASFGEQIMKSLAAAGLDVSWKPAIAENRVGATRGVIAAYGFGNEPGKQFATAFTVVLASFGITVLAPDVLRLGGQAPTQPSDDNWVVINVGDKF